MSFDLHVKKKKKRVKSIDVQESLSVAHIRNLAYETRPPDATGWVPEP